MVRDLREPRGWDPSDSDHPPNRLETPLSVFSSDSHAHSGDKLDPEINSRELGPCFLERKVHFGRFWGTKPRAVSSSAGDGILSC